MRYSGQTGRFASTLVVLLVPKMRLGAPKRNVAVGLVYLLLLWILAVQALSVV